MGDPMQITRLINRVLQGEVRVPGFQREFVWEPNRAALLMDSIYKGYPFGSILLWRTRTKLKTERNLGTFELPDPEADYPIDYVLDGQQRITSIFSTFQTRLTSTAEDPEKWLPIYYDFQANSDAQDSQFQALPTKDADPDRYFPLATFFNPVKFAAKQRELVESRLEEIVEVQSRFSGVLIPVENFAEEDRTRVAIVFERVNRQGVKLDTFQLLTAWTWSDEFDLQQEFATLSEKFEAFGFDDVGTDNDLMLRCVAAVLKEDPSPASLIDINGAEVRDEFPRISKSFERAIDFLQRELEVRHLKFLPYTGLLIPLCAYFSRKRSRSVSRADNEVLLRWFWRSSFVHRYSGNPLRNIQNDVTEAIKLATKKPSNLDEINVELDETFYTNNSFNNRTVATKTFILQLASHSPRSFISGSKISLSNVLAEPGRREYHHCYPRNYIKQLADQPTSDVNCLANLAFLDRTENREISDLAPSVYKKKMGRNHAQILASQLIPSSLFDDDFETFIEERSTKLLSSAFDLMDTGIEDE